MTRLNFKHLYYFWVVAKHGSIARASEILHLTPPTLSSQISTLEDHIGAPLLRKQGRQLMVTEMGAAAYEYAEEIFSLGMELENFLKSNQQSRQAVLKVGIADVMPKLVIYRLLEPAFSMSENLRIVCKESTFDALTKDLVAHKLDLILADRRVDPDANLKAYNHALGSSGVTFFGNDAHWKTTRAGFPGSLHQSSMLLPASNTALRRSIDQWFEAENITPHIVGEFDDSALLKVFGQAGVGVFCAPSIIEKEILKQYRVKVLGRTKSIEERFYAITAERRIKHPVISRLCDLATEFIDSSQ